MPYIKSHEWIHHLITLNNLRKFQSRMDTVLGAWRTYQSDMRPETRNDFLRAMDKAFPVLKEGE